MDLSTNMMGLDLTNPLVVGASPLSDRVDAIRACEDAGASAIVMRSLFMEQIAREQIDALHHVAAHEDTHAEATSFVPSQIGYAFGPDEYLEQIRRLKEAVSIPVVGSLNGTHRGYWTHHAKRIEEAGADGIELNVYYLPFDADEPGTSVEERFVDVLAQVRTEVRIPVSMKLGPYFSSPLHTMRRLREAGADGFVLFNRLFEPEIDIEALEVHTSLYLSSPDLLRMRLLWLAATFGRVDAPLTVTGGVHEVTDVVRAVMAGASSVQMASVLLQRGPRHLLALRDGLVQWMEEREYESIAQMCGSMSRERCPDPEAYDRANYIRSLQSWRPPA